MGFVQLHPGHVHLTDYLTMVGLSTLGRALLQAVHGFEIQGIQFAGHPAPSMTCREGLTTLPGHGQLVNL